MADKRKARYDLWKENRSKWMTEDKNFFKRHGETLSIIGAILMAVLWMNHQVNSLTMSINDLQKEIVIIKTVMMMKGEYPKELATNIKEQK